jgi:hypothetical protein
MRRRSERPAICDHCGEQQMVPWDTLGRTVRGYATVVTGDPQAVLCRKCWWKANREQLRKERER